MIKPQRIFIPGPLPGLNELIAAAMKREGTWFGYGNIKYCWGQDVCVWLRGNYKKIPRPIPYRLWIDFTWLEPHKKRDPDNVASGGRKIIFDSMVKENIIKNDGWKQIAGWTDHFDTVKENPGVWLCLKKAK